MSWRDSNTDPQITKLSQAKTFKFPVSREDRQAYFNLQADCKELSTKIQVIFFNYLFRFKYFLVIYSISLVLAISGFLV